MRVLFYIICVVFGILISIVPVVFAVCVVMFLIFKPKKKEISSQLAPSS